MDNETGGHSKTGDFRNVDMAKNGKNQLDGTYVERRSINIGRRGKISYIQNQSKTKKLDGTPAERRLSSERNNGGENGGGGGKRKSKEKTIGLDDVGGIRQTQGRSSKPGEVEPSDVWTCQRAENLKKKKKKLQEAHSKENGDFLLC